MGNGLKYHKDDEGNDVIDFGGKKLFGKNGIVFTGGNEGIEAWKAGLWILGIFPAAYILTHVVIHVFHLK